MSLINYMPNVTCKKRGEREKRTSLKGKVACDGKTKEGRKERTGGGGRSKKRVGRLGRKGKIVRDIPKVLLQ